MKNEKKKKEKKKIEEKSNRDIDLRFIYSRGE